jgi:flagellar protein FliS
MSSIGHNAYRANTVETASPEQLTLMCYDGAIRFMNRAARALDTKDLATASSAVGRAQAIVNELNVTLDMEAGGEIARNLRDIYLFVNRHLGTSLVQHSSADVRQAVQLITELRDAWAQSMNLTTGSAAA